MPSATTRDALPPAAGSLARRLNDEEERARLAVTREPDATFAGLAHAWASGGELDDVLGDEEVSGGDFVRNVKQLIDLCRQLGELAPMPDTAAAARQAADLLYRAWWPPPRSSRSSTDPCQRPRYRFRPHAGCRRSLRGRRGGPSRSAV